MSKCPESTGVSRSTSRLLLLSIIHHPAIHRPMSETAKNAVEILRYRNTDCRGIFLLRPPKITSSPPSRPSFHYDIKVSHVTYHLLLSRNGPTRKKRRRKETMDNEH